MSAPFRKPSAAEIRFIFAFGIGMMVDTILVKKIRTLLDKTIDQTA
jgi:hypothetical protein